MAARSLSIFTTLLAVVASAAGQDDLCYGSCTGAGAEKECTFTFSVNLFASELGYFSVEECADQGVMPVLAVEKGVTYKFVQQNITNYKHPLGLAYFPDGAHDDKDELEPGIVPPGSSSTCAADMSCPAPMYLLNGAPLGSYSNNALYGNLTSGEEDFGLDVYEPSFFLPITDWVANGKYEISLLFDVDDFDGDMFYFCHIHQFMSGRIKLVDSAGALLKEADEPAIPYSYDQPSDYDKTCGTYNLDKYQLPNPECPSRFVCNVPEDNPRLAKFSGCIDSMDCAMMAGMTTNVASGSEVALFIHQMIPHHQNAVNMAKALLKSGALNCPDITQETDDCTMTQIMYHIINGQNHEIQLMRGVLEGQGYLKEDDCPVAIDGAGDLVVEKQSSEPAAGSTSSAATWGYKVLLHGALFAGLALVM